MTASADILELVLSALVTPTGPGDAPVYPTSAGAEVYLPRDWPLQLATFPVLLLQMVSEEKVSLGPTGAQQFTVTTTIRINGRVTALAAEDDASAGEAEAALWALQRQVERAVINYTPLARVTQQIPFVRSSIGIDSSGATHVGQLRIDLGAEFYQGPEDFYAPELVELDEVRVSAPPFAGVGIDLVFGTADAAAPAGVSTDLESDNPGLSAAL